MQSPNPIFQPLLQTNLLNPKKALGVIAAACLIGGCATGGPQVTHHWASQDKVANNIYRNDVAACSAGTGQLDATSAEFKAYQQCMNERGYTLVAANDVGEPGRE